MTADQLLRRKRLQCMDCWLHRDAVSSKRKNSLLIWAALSWLYCCLWKTKLANVLYFPWSEAATFSSTAALPVTGFHCCQKLIRNSSQTHCSLDWCNISCWKAWALQFNSRRIEPVSIQLQRFWSYFESCKEKYTLHVFSAWWIALVQAAACLCGQL